MQEKIRFLGALVEKLDWSPLEDDESKFKMHIRAPLTTRLADSLRCRGLCYSEPEGNAGKPAREQVQPSPRQWQGSIKIPVEISGGDVALGDRSFPFSLLHNVKVERDETEDSLALFVSLILHLNGSEILIWKFCQDQLKRKFSFEVKPAQGAFKFTDDAEDEDDGDEPEEKAAGTLARKATMAAKGAD